jgi:hypothetical protein
MKEPIVMSPDKANEVAQPFAPYALEAMTEQAKAIIQSGFDLFAEQTQQLAEELAQFNQRHKQARRPVEHGGLEEIVKLVPERDQAQEQGGHWDDTEPQVGDGATGSVASDYQYLY